jgi:DNA-binding transcriptional LysR family regulator
MADLDLNELAVFVRVVDRGGFAPAARELRVPTSTVSRTVARLEEVLGAQLLHRTSRSLGVTADGRELYASVAPAIASLVRAARSLGGSSGEPRGKLRVTAPNDLGSTFLAHVVVAFAEQNPLVEVELVLTTRTVSLIEEGLDLAVRAGRLVDSSLIARKVGDLEEQLVASPAYLERRGQPRTVEALADHPCILFRPAGGSRTWRLHGPKGEVDVQAKGRVYGDDYGFVRAAALADGGIALLPRILCALDVAAGTLVRVLPDYEVRGAALYVVYPPSQHVPAKVSAFRDFLIERFAGLPEPCGRAAKGQPAESSAAPGEGRRQASRGRHLR